MFVLKKIIAAFLMPVPIGLFLLLLALVFLLKNSYKKAKIFLFFEFFVVCINIKSNYIKYDNIST